MLSEAHTEVFCYSSVNSAPVVLKCGTVRAPVHILFMGSNGTYNGAIISKA